MSTLVLVVIAVSLVCTNCNTKKNEPSQTDNTELEKELKEKEELITKYQEEEKKRAKLAKLKNQYMNELTYNFNRIADSLSTIKNKIVANEQAITNQTSEFEQGNEIKLSQTEEVFDNIRYIETMIEDQRSAIKNMHKSYEKKFRESGIQISELSSKISFLTNQLMEREQEVLLLQQKVQEFQHEIAKRDSIIEEQNKLLNTVYYISGTENELEKFGLVKKEGGIPGIAFRTLVLTANYNKNEALYKEFDISEGNMIPLKHRPDRRVKKFLPKRKEDTYSIARHDDNPGISYIIVTNLAEFWKDRYLVIVMEE